MFDHTPRWAGKRADFAVDLGTANTLVIDRNEGVVFEEPSFCCFDEDASTSLYAAGSAAKIVAGREVKRLRTVRPLQNGVLVDVAATRELLKFAVRPLLSRLRLRRPRAIIGVPTDATQAERRALSKASYDAGLAEPLLLPEPLLSAMGSNMDVDAPRGRMIVDCGAGTTDVMVLSLGGVCASRSVRGGGEAVDSALLQHLHLKHHFHIGQSSAEQLKLTLTKAIENRGPDHIEVKGLDITRGLPMALLLPVEELRPIIEKYANEVTAAVRAVFAKTDPDLAQDIFEDGIHLAGGASMTALVAEHIESATGLAVRRQKDPKKAVANGLRAMLDRPIMPW